MSTPGSIIGKIIAAVSPPKNDGFVGRAVVLPLTLQATQKAQIISGEVIEQAQDEVLRILTPEGEVEVQVKGRNLPAKGQQVRIEVPAGNPPRQVVITQNQQPSQQTQIQAPQAQSQSAPTPSPPISPPQTPQVQTSQTQIPQTPAAEIQKQVQAQNAQVTRETLEQIARQAGAEPKPLPPLKEGQPVRLTPLTPLQVKQALEQLPPLPPLQTQVIQSAYTRLDFIARIIVQDAQATQVIQFLQALPQEVQNAVRQIIVQTNGSGSQPQTQQTTPQPNIPPAPPLSAQAIPQPLSTGQTTSFTPNLNFALYMPVQSTPAFTPLIPPQVFAQSAVQQILNSSFIQSPLLQTPQASPQIISPLGTPQVNSILPQTTPSPAPIQQTILPNITAPAPVALNNLQQTLTAPIFTPALTLPVTQTISQTATPAAPLTLDGTVQNFSNPLVQITSPKITPALRYDGLVQQFQQPQFHLLNGQPNTIPAQVIGFTPQNLPIVMTRLPGFPFQQSFILQAPVGNLQIGAQIQITPQPSNILTQPTLPSAQTLPTIPTLTDLLRPGPWPALEQLYQASVQVSAQAAATLSATIPNAGAAAQQIGTAAFFFLAMVRSGDISSWLGGNTIGALQKAGKGNVIQRLTQEVGQMQRGEAPVGEWRATPIPMFYDGEVQRMTLYTRRDYDGDTREEKENQQTRFIFDLDMTRMGPVQLDGLIRGKRLDMVVRTQSPFSEPMRQIMRQTYVIALEDSDLHGELSFQGDARAWVNVLQKEETFGVDT